MTRDVIANFLDCRVMDLMPKVGPDGFAVELVEEFRYLQEFDTPIIEGRS